MKSTDFIFTINNLIYICQRGQTALHLVCPSGNLESVKYLLANGADVRAKDEV